MLEPDLIPEQAGFCPQKSRVDHVNSMGIIVEQSVDWRFPLYLLFTAFDTLDHKAIWGGTSMERYTTRNHLIYSSSIQDSHMQSYTRKSI